LPIVFNSSYQKASKYWFYSGQPSLSLNDYKRRRNNYNFWPLEDEIFGRPVYVIDPQASYSNLDSMQTPIGNLRYAMDSAFYSFGGIAFIPANKKYLVKEGQPFILRASFKGNDYEPYLQQGFTTLWKIKLGVYDKQKWIQDVNLHLSLQQLFTMQTLAIPVNLKLQKGTYYLRFAIQSDAGWFTHNSDKIKLVIE